VRQKAHGDRPWRDRLVIESRLRPSLAAQAIRCVGQPALIDLARRLGGT
jgi:hypothetical protein